MVTARLRSVPLLLLLLACALGTPPSASPSRAQGPADARPDTADYVVLNHGRQAGAMRVVAGGDSAVVRFDYQDRQRGPHTETRYRFAADGTPLRIESHGLATGAVASTAAAEHVEIAGGAARWVSDVDSGGAPAPPGALYLLRRPNPFDVGVLARVLLPRAGRTAELLPAGRARAEIVADTTLPVRGTPTRLRLVMVDVGTLDPLGVWLDERDAVFASDAGWFPTVRRGGEGVLPALREAERAYQAGRSAALAARLTTPAPSALVIRNGDVFDSERGTVRTHTTVIVRGDRIVAVGPASTLRVPAGATVIDATGKTVLPGLWDMHTHLGLSGETSQGALHLAAGVTTVRDMASDRDLAVSVRERAERGTLLAPRELLAGIIEGPGLWAAPTDVLVRTEAEARSWVARYDSLGYRQIKVYNLVHQDLIPTIAEEARRRGMRLSGHIPRGLSVPAAIALGFDEINHIAPLVSTFYQDSLYVPRMRAYSEVAAAVAPRFDVDAPAVTALIQLMRQRGTVMDATLDAFAARGIPLPDATDAVYGPALAWLPPAQRRAVAAPPPPGGRQGAARAAAIDATYARLLKRLYDARVTLVAGTDNVMPGLSYHGELELYERAGIPAPAVLQIATIGAARVMKEDRDYGSITPGKVADLVIVAGRPAERIRDVRRTEHVVRAGRVYRARDLYAAVGVTLPAW